jgi:hypothetical protein
VARAGEALERHPKLVRYPLVGVEREDPVVSRRVDPGVALRGNRLSGDGHRPSAVRARHCDR